MGLVPGHLLQSPLVRQQALPAHPLQVPLYFLRTLLGFLHLPLGASHGHFEHRLGTFPVGRGGDLFDRAVEEAGGPALELFRGAASLRPDTDRFSNNSSASASPSATASVCSATSQRMLAASKPESGSSSSILAKRFRSFRSPLAHFRLERTTSGEAGPETSRKGLPRCLVKSSCAFSW